MGFNSVLSYLSSTPSIPLLTVGILSVIWYMTSLYNDKRPPFPWIKLPLIGNMLSLQFSKDKAYILFYKTSKNPKYDKVFMIKIGGHEFCIINHIDLVKEALMKKQVDFANRFQIYSAMEMTKGGQDIVCGNYGPRWRFHRKLVHQALRNFASGSKLEGVVQRATLQTIELIKQKGNEAFVIKPILELLQFNIFSGLLFGREYDFEDPEFKQFMNATQEGLDAFGSGLPADLFPWLKFLPFQGTRMKKLVDKFITFMEKELKEHRETFDANNLRDITDSLLMAQHELESEESEEKFHLTDFHLVMTLFDVFGAGLDTINATLQFVVAEAVMHPDIQEKLSLEADKLSTTRLPRSEDRVHLPYTEAFLCEVFRHNTFAVFGIPLATTCDTTIGKYELPKNTGVIINFWALHNDTDFWDDPSEFRPQRFLLDTGELAPRPASFLPFSLGKRVCLGENLAKTMLMIILPMLFQHVMFEKPDDFEFSCEDFGLANVPKPYKVCVKMRN